MRLQDQSSFPERLTMLRLTAALLCALLLWLPGRFPALAQDAVQSLGPEAMPSIGPETGLPLPRFVSLKVSEARMRAQPSTGHPILYIYLRIGLPFQVVAERGDWRRVRDHLGAEGWMKNTLLSGERTFRVTPPITNLYARADTSSPVRGEMEQGVIGSLRLCRSDGWCRASVEDLSGWVRAEDLWGVFPGEVF